MEVRTASHTTKNTLLPGISLDLEIVSNLRPKKIWLKVRTRGSQPSISVPIFSLFTKMTYEVSRSGPQTWNIAKSRRALSSFRENCVRQPGVLFCRKRWRLQSRRKARSSAAVRRVPTRSKASDQVSFPRLLIRRYVTKS